MLLALAFFAQIVAAPIPTAADEGPLRLWLGPSPVAPGEVVPVYVAAASAGYLLVLRVATDGRVDVVFPADPGANGHIGRGTYQLRAPGNRPALVAREPRGTGLVLAALSGTPFRFAEFSQAGRWDRDLLVASHPGADGPGTLTDIAQRMLGDSRFNHDFALYTVRAGPPRSAGQSDAARPTTPPAAPSIGLCNGCTIVYQTVSPAPVLEPAVIQRTIVEPAESFRVVIVTSPCEPFVGGCHGTHDRSDAPRVKTAGICQTGIDCPAGVGGPAKALALPAGRTGTSLRAARLLPRRP